jgi:hypothetical protein
MAQYWLQTPIENAKEVVQRFVDDNAAALPGLAGKTVSYTYQTEVIFYSGQFPVSPYINDEIYFGTFYLTATLDTSVSMIINDGMTNAIITFDCSSGIASGQYPSIIWNDNNGLPEAPGYFVGYKFTLA